MNDLLFLSHRLPYPPDKGEKIRAWHMLQRLARTHRVHVGCFIDDPADWPHAEVLRPLCAELFCRPLRKLPRKLRSLRRLAGQIPLSIDYFDDAPLRRWVDARLAGGIDRAFVYCSAMAPYLLAAPARVHRVLDMVDVDSRKWADYAASSNWPARLIWAREARTLLNFERRAAAAFDRTVLVSAAEAACFAGLASASAARIGAIDNGVDLAHFSPGQEWDSPYPTGDGGNLLFTGTMDYRPNVDAMTWFAAEVMPRLRAQTSRRVHLTIVGAHPAGAVSRLAGPDITVTGRVPDVRPYLAHADAVVAPLRIARGTQNKVLEAMAMGRPVIASAQAFEGLHAHPGRDLLVAADAAAMAGRIGEVLSGAHATLGTAARALVQSRYDWEQTLAPLDTLFDRVATDAWRHAS